MFGERRVGSSLAPGIPATVWMQGRGCLLRANVAGRWTPWCEAEDVEGMFALVAHGGTAVLRRLVIENRGVAHAWLTRRWSWLLLGACAGLLLGGVGVGRRVPVGAGLCLGATLVGLVAWQVVGTDLQPLRMPPPGALLALLGGPTALGCTFLAATWAQRRWLKVVLLIPGLGLWTGLYSLSSDLLRSDTREVDAVFGPVAGNSVSEALAQIVRGPFGLHSPADEQRGVFLLGGRLPYARLGPATEHLEPLLRGELRGKHGTPVAVVGLPTEEGRAHVRQQWAMFSRFYTGYHPRVIVFGVPVTEGDRGEASIVVQDTLAVAREYARSHDAALVLFTEADLAAELLAVLRTAERDGLPLVVADDGEAPAAVAKKLAAAILPLLP